MVAKLKRKLKRAARKYEGLVRLLKMSIFIAIFCYVVLKIVLRLGG